MAVAVVAVAASISAAVAVGDTVSIGGRCSQQSRGSAVAAADVAAMAFDWIAAIAVAGQTSY